MFSRTIVIAAVVSASFSSWSTSVVSAQDPPAIPMAAAQQAPAAFLTSVVAAAAQPGQFPARIMREAPKPDRRSPLLMSLYVSTVAMQALDASSTVSALNQGAVEANPLMRGAASNKAVFFTTKAAAAATTIFVANRLAKRHKTSAMIFLAAVNSVYAGIVVHNYRVARGQR